MDANILFFKNKNNFSKYILALDTIKDKSFVTHYLLFFVNCENKEMETGTSFNEKLNFSSIVKKNKVIAFQFYSGKSGNSGVILLKNAVKNILQ